MIFSVYVLIGAALFALTLMDADVRADLRSEAPAMQFAHLVFFLLMWPMVLIPAGDE